MFISITEHSLLLRWKMKPRVIFCHTSSKYNCPEDLISSLFGVVTFTERTIPSLPWYTSTIRLISQWDLGVWSTDNITKSRISRFRDLFVNFFPDTKVWRYSFVHFLQYIFVAAWTAFYLVLKFIYESLKSPSNGLDDAKTNRKWYGVRASKSSMVLFLGLMGVGWRSILLHKGRWLMHLQWISVL